MAFLKLLVKAAKKGVKSASKKDTAKVANRVKKTISSVAASKGVKSIPKKYTMAFINKQPASVKKELTKDRKKFLAARTASAETRKKLKSSQTDEFKSMRGLGKRKGVGMSFEAVPTKRDRRIEGSGAQSSRPPGSKGKASVKADSPRGGTTGMSMKDAKKKQMRDTANLGSEMKKLGRKYDDLSTGVKRTLIAAIKSGDSKKITKAFKGTNMTRAEFVKVHNKRLGGR